MSRRATPSQAAQNQQTIKSLLKLDTNKICADCKRNKRKSRAVVIALPSLGLITFASSKANEDLIRSTMGFLEHWHFHLHPLLGDSQRNGHSYQ